INGDGTVTYTHDGSEILSDIFSYTISDISGAISNTATVNITVNAINDAPAALDDVGNVNKGGAVTIDLAANDTDVDNAIDLSSISIIGAPANGALTINGDGTVTYTHDGSEILSDTFTYTISDISGAISNTATVNITVNTVNDAPTTSGITDVNVNEDAANEIIDLNVAFDDIDNPDTELTYTIVGNTNVGLFASASVNASTGELILDYAANINGSSQISMRATDLAGASVDTLFTVTVSPVNDTPALSTNTGAVVTSTSEMLIDSGMLSTTDIDNTVTEIQYMVTALPANGTLLLNGIALVLNDTFTEDDLINNRISYQVAGSPTANDQFVFTVTDSTNTLTNNAFNIIIQLALPVVPDEIVEPIVIVEPEAPILPDEIIDPVSPVIPGNNEIDDGFESGFNPIGSSTPPQQLSTEDNVDGFENNGAPVEEDEISSYNLEPAATYTELQVKSIKALWIAVDQMKQQITESTEEEVSKIELKAAAVSSSGVALTAGVVAWVLRSGALMTSLMSSIPLWKGYDPLPILAYREDEDEEDLSEDKVPTSLNELRKIKELKEKIKPSQSVDAMFSNT
ncbi:MAG: tandem-95 repeat protein, partial [Gammaproteobacteria bacterium]|nr:tandem-95 repeat protein [Gammaproteobacteria bacterium]